MVETCQTDRFFRVKYAVCTTGGRTEIRMHLTENEKKEIREILAPYLKDPEVLQMKEFIQHGEVTTYDHCKNVVRCSYCIARHCPGASSFHMNELLVGALLHDFYGYDWHGRSLANAHHGFTHPEKARVHARDYFQEGEQVQHIIRSHMWPLTLFHMPMTREAWVVTAADKYCSAYETLFLRKHSRPIGL